MPANLVNLEAVGKAFGTRVLLQSVSLGVAGGERIGVVGRNGGGKTTLVRVLAGQEPPDSGRVSHAGGLAVGLLTQADDLDPHETVHALVLGQRDQHEWAGDTRVRDVLSGLFGPGIAVPGTEAAGGLARRVGELSGGERRRVALARLLVDDPDLLVLDEPTNHLDVEGITWLARHLTTRRGALVVVTHDRWFLDEVCTRTWEVADGAVREYDGGYAAYVLARAERERIAAADQARRANLLRKELAWLRRGPPARTSKPRFRIDAANALIADEPPARDTVELARFASSRLGRAVFELESVDLPVPGPASPSRPPLLRDLSWLVGAGDRIAVVGVNGSGKTTLLRLLAGQVAPASGRVVVGSTVRLAYLSQQVAELPGRLRVLEAVEQVRRAVTIGTGGKARELTAGQLCERFGFAGEKQWTPVGELSGGERRRLQLMRLLMDEPNVLLLDEPTNDLDIDTLTQLEDLLDGWPGTLVVVSHDRYFVERVTDAVYALPGDATLRHLPGGIEEYLALRERSAAESERGAEVTRGGTPRASRGDTRAARKELTRIERRLDRIEAEEERLHAALAAHATDYAKVAELDAELRGLATERERLEERWLLLAEE